MAYSGKVIESPDTRLVFKETAKDTNGELLRFEQFVQKDHAPVPAHVHGRQEERFVVLSGRMGVRAGEKEIVLGPGEEIVVPPGTPHTFWNASPDGEVLHHAVELRPALKSEVFFETVFGLQRDGRLVPRKAGGRAADGARDPGARELARRSPDTTPEGALQDPGPRGPSLRVQGRLPTVQRR